MAEITLPKTTLARPRAAEAMPGAEPDAGARAVPRLSLLQGVLLGAALLLVALTAIFPVPGYDLWWQLKAGELMAKTHSIPNADVFSFTANGQPWVLQEWLTELMLYGLYSHLPAVTLVWYKILAVTLAFGLVFWRCWLRSGQFLLSLSLTVLAAYAARWFFDVRPQVLTYLFLAALLLLLDGRRAGRWPRAIYAVPVLMLLWVNCHGGFLLGLAVLAVELGGEAIQALLAGEIRSPRLRTLACVTGLSFLAALLNPAGIGAYLYPFTLMGHQRMLDTIAEWFSPNFHYLWLRPYELLVLLLIAGLGLSRGRRGRMATGDLADLVLAVALVHASLFSTRHVPVFTVVATPIIAGHLAVALAAAGTWLRERRLGGGRAWATAGATVALLFGLAHEWQRVPRSDWFGYCTQNSAFPKRACDFLARQNWNPRLLNEYTWGGYCIWQLYPKYQVFIDGRAEVYFNKAFGDYDHLAHCAAGWGDLLDEWSIDTVLMPPTDAIARALPTTGEWHVAYQDEQAVILRRNHPSAS
jgi:hypothetical protein